MASLLKFLKPTNHDASADANVNNHNKHQANNIMDASRRPLILVDTSRPRSAKRKARHDPYEELADTEGEGAGDNAPEITPAKATPSSQRTAPFRMSSVTPASGSRPRSSLFIKRGIARPVVKSRRSEPLGMATAKAAAVARTSSPESGKKANSARAKTSDIRRQQPEVSAPEAPMGGVELFGDDGTHTPSASSPASPAHGKGKAKQTATESTQPAKKTDNDEDEDDREELEVEKLLKHRMSRDKTGAVELLVLWAGENEEDATWEAENEIQEGAEEALYDYWRSQGGRVAALFHKPKNPPAETYHVFKILRHERRNRGGFQFEVQWVGHPSIRGETSMETETKLKSVAPEMLAAYWESVGGRDTFLAPRGRAKKSRTE